MKIDSELKLDEQINSLVRSSFFQLEQLPEVNPFYFSDLERVMHFCPSAKTTVTTSMLVLVRPRCHYCSGFPPLHWLLVHFKILLFTSKMVRLHLFLGIILGLYTPLRFLRLADLSLLIIPKSSLKHRED